MGNNKSKATSQKVTVAHLNLGDTVVTKVDSGVTVTIQRAEDNLPPPYEQNIRPSAQHIRPSAPAYYLNRDTLKRNAARNNVPQSCTEEWTAFEAAPVSTYNLYPTLNDPTLSTDTSPRFTTHKSVDLQRESEREGNLYNSSVNANRNIGRNSDNNMLAHATPNELRVQMPLYPTLIIESDEERESNPYNSSENASRSSSNPDKPRQSTHHATLLPPCDTKLRLQIPTTRFTSEPLIPERNRNVTVKSTSSRTSVMHNDSPMDESFNQNMNCSTGNNLPQNPIHLQKTERHTYVFKSEKSDKIKNVRQNYSQNNRCGDSAPRDLGYKYLETLCEKSEAEIATALLRNQKNFQDLVKKELRPDLMVLVIKLLARLCGSNSNMLKQNFLELVWCDEFLDQLENYVSKSSEQRKERFLIVVDDLMLLYHCVHEVLPTANDTRLPDLLIKTQHAIRLSEICHNLVFNKFVNERLKKLLSSVPKLPDYVCNLSIFPTVADVLSEDVVFARKIPKTGKYVDVEHYREVQFHLLRNEIVVPLRDNILGYLKARSVPKREWVDSFGVYREVTFVEPYAKEDRTGFVVNFDPNGRMAKRNWQSSKALRFGSLICFTRNNFQDVFFATIIERNVIQLTQGRTVVQLGEGSQLPGDVFNRHFTMVESEVFFTPYFHVMKAIRSLTNCTFPMTQYILQAQKQVATPRYLRFSGPCTYQLFNYQVHPLNVSSWPDAASLGMNDSQYQALQLALTSEFAIVQGQPGTGKTFLTHQLIKVLLLNTHLWGIPACPILVVCFTNHALDQILEGVLLFTNKIVRIGGQSNSKALAEFTLNKWKMKLHKNRIESYFSTKDNCEKTSSLKLKIKNLKGDLEAIDSNSGIVAWSVMKEVAAKRHARALQGDDQMVQWLEGGKLEYTQLVQASCITKPDGEEDLDENASVISSQADEDGFDLDGAAANMIPVIVFAVNFRDVQIKLNGLLKDGQRTSEQFQELSVRLKYYRLLGEERPSLPPVHVLDLWSLSPRDRRALYLHWLGLLREKLAKRLNRLEMQLMDDIKVLREVQVLGMTTTCAARFRTMIEELGPKILIVEESGEVKESHVVAALTSKCEHLILIGDHQESQPSGQPSTSLLKRMVASGFPCTQLYMQCRMRPEIASLLAPNVYKNMLNHPFVSQYQPVLGMNQNVFFVTHTKEEQMADSKCRKNAHEATFLLSLAHYLILQGYKPEEITILTMSTEQKLYILKEQKNLLKLNGMLVSIVDSFQGEQNRIILLSLVGALPEVSTGFLDADSRVCVALSRAMEGLYIIGNEEIVTPSSHIWPKVLSTLKNKSLIGSQLLLKCQVHPKHLTKVASKTDFELVRGLGCLLPCEVSLKCGHFCKRKCHLQDRSHRQYVCREPCNRVPEGCIPATHLCPRRCHEECGPCKTETQFTRPCGHIEIVDCSRAKVRFMETCSHSCKAQLRCGHACVRKCNHPKDPHHKKYQCYRPCSARLACRHWCTRPCFAPCDPCLKCLES